MLIITLIPGQALKPWNTGQRSGLRGKIGALILLSYLAVAWLETNHPVLLGSEFSLSRGHLDCKQVSRAGVWGHQSPVTWSLQTMSWCGQWTHRGLISGLWSSDLDSVTRGSDPPSPADSKPRYGTESYTPGYKFTVKTIFFKFLRFF